LVARWTIWTCTSFLQVRRRLHLSVRAAPRFAPFIYRVRVYTYFLKVVYDGNMANRSGCDADLRYLRWSNYYEGGWPRLFQKLMGTMLRWVLLLEKKEVKICHFSPSKLKKGTLKDTNWICKNFLCKFWKQIHLEKMKKAPDGDGAP
jgi:hypothetical protein